MNKVMAVFNDLWWMTPARQEVCRGQCFATLNDFVFESCNSAMGSPIPGDEIEDALPFVLVATNLPAKHFSPNDFLDMDMWKSVYVDELWFEMTLFNRIYRLSMTLSLRKFIFIFIQLLVQVEISIKKESLLGWKITNIIGGSIYKL